MNSSIEILLDSIELIKLTDEEYFHNPEYKKYVSNSRLGLLNPEEGGSPEKFIEGFEENFYSESYELGSAVHSIVLQPDEYFISNLEKPSGKLGIFVENIFSLRQSSNIKLVDAVKQASILADYYSGKLSPTRLRTAIKKGIKYYLERIANKDKVYESLPIYLSSTLKERAEQCISSIKSNEKITELLTPCEWITIFNEYAIFATVKVTIDGVEHLIKVKGKLDDFSINNMDELVVLNDLKTTGKPVKFFMGNKVKHINEDGIQEYKWYNGSFQNYHYYRQIAMYLWLLKAALKAHYDIDYKYEVNMMVVETFPEYKSALYKVPNKYIQYGLEEFKTLLIEAVKWNQKI